MKLTHSQFALLLPALFAVLGCNDTAIDGSATSDSAGSPPVAATTTEPADPPSETARATPPGDSDNSAKADAKPPHELIDGITSPQLVSAFESIHKAATENPDAVLVQLQYAQVLQSVGQQRVQQKQMEQAYRTFSKSGDVARALVAKPDLPESANSLLSVVFYNDACAASVVGHDTEAALVSLEEAIKRGFNDFELLNSDEDLKAVRALPDFTAKLESWKEALAEIARKKIEQELAEFKSFPFDFSLTDVTGKPIKLADYQGKVVIVDIWGTWCPPCRAEIPSFVKLQEQYGEKGFQMVGLNKENVAGPEGDKLVQTFMKDNNMNYPCAMIDQSTQSQVPDFQGYPTTLFVDRSGKVRLKLIGLHPYSQLESIVQFLLAEEASAKKAAESESNPTAE